MEGENELPPDELRCKRSDGRGWRCKKLAIVGKSLCEPHINRQSSKKKPKLVANCDSIGNSGKKNPNLVDDGGGGDGNGKDTPRVRIRFRVKPEPESGDEGDGPGTGTVRCDMSFATLALPAVGVGREGGGMRGPRTKRPNVVDDDVEMVECVRVEEKRGPRTKRPNVVGGGDGDEEMVECVRVVDLVEKRGPRSKRPNVVGDDVVGVVGGLEKRGPRTKRPNVVDGVDGGDMGESLNVVDDVEGEKMSVDVVVKRGPRVKTPNVGCDVEEGENVGWELSEKRGPRVKRPNVVGDAEEEGESDNDDGADDVGVELSEKRGPRVKTPNVVRDVEGGENVGWELSEKRGPRVKRPNVVGDAEGKEGDNDDGDGADDVGVELSEKWGPRVKIPNVVDDVEEEEKENGGGDDNGNDNVGVSEKRGPRVKMPNVVGDMDEGENDEDMAVDDMAVEGSEVLRCTRYSGNGWRCEKPAKDGYSMCEDHVSKKGRDTPAQKPEKKVTNKKAKRKEKESLPPDEFRCTRHDTRNWRCKRWVFEGEKLCEAHFKGFRLSDVKENGQGKKKAKKKVKSKPVEKKSETVEKKNETVERSPELVVVKNEVLSENEEDIEDRLALVADLAVAEAEELAMVAENEEDLRCKRTDGRKWRCKKRVLEGKTLCELHFEQGKLRQQKSNVPDSLKRKITLVNLDNGSGEGSKRMKGDSIGGFLKSKINQKKKKGAVKTKSVPGEITKDLPFGLMEIPAAPVLENGESSAVKLGVASSNHLVKKHFRSKNVEPPPVGISKVVPFAGNAGKAKSVVRRKCHRCKNSDKSSLTKCLSCKKRFFCANCIKQRNTDPQVSKDKCPVCSGNCDCKACGINRAKDESIKAISKVTYQGSKFQQLQHLIKLLLPIIEQINQDQSVETEIEARFKGQDLSEVEIRQAEVGYRDQCCCNNCKSSILDFHRSCQNCSYNLCLSCCREYSQGGELMTTQNSCPQPHNIVKTRLPGMEIRPEKILQRTSAQINGCADPTSAASVLNLTACHNIPCPPVELGGCDNGLLDLRCIFPLNWTKELEISANEMASGHEFPQNSENSLHCSLCASAIQTADKNKEIQEASRRVHSHDNFVYCPSSSDDHHYMFAHFQHHWLKGHPLKVRNVLQYSSAMSWDPLALFCWCLENNPSGVNRKDANEAVNCTDWYEVEFGSRESFSQSQEEGYRHTQHKTLRVKATLSSNFSRKLLKDRYREIIHAFPLQEYTNPMSGILNIAGKLPEGFPESKLGPHVCISFGSRDVVARGELVTKLYYNPYDMVNILVHVADVTCSTEQHNKTLMLISHNNMKDKLDQSSGEVILQDGIQEGSALNHGVAGASSSPPTNDNSAVNLRDDELPAKLQTSDTDSDASVICSGPNDSPNKSIDHIFPLELLENSRLSDKRPSESRGAQWDVFRRQDVPKLLEYIMKHVDELSCSYDLLKNVVHPIFGGSFYLDSIHIMQLKEEFDIEPWSFNQCLGEAVFIPAGCPYQTRHVKSCVNIAMGFISPENASECIKLNKEIRTLPNDHKAKEMKLEVEKMAICSIDEAIKEMYRLQSEGSIHSDKGAQIPIPNS